MRIRADMYKWPNLNGIFNHRFIRLYIVQNDIFAYNAIFNDAVRANRASCTDFRSALELCARQNRGFCSDFNVFSNNDAVCVDEVDTVLHVLLQHLPACNFVQMQQVFPSICSQDYIRIVCEICTGFLALLQSQTNSIRQVIFTLYIRLGQTFQQCQQVCCPEPIRTGIDFLNLPLCIGGILFFYDGSNARFTSQNSAIAERVVQLCGDDRNRIALCSVQLICLLDGFAVHKRSIPTQY